MKNFIRIAMPAAAALLIGVGNASAANCLRDAAGDSGLNCTANDFSISSVSVSNVSNNDCGGGSNTFTFTGTLDLAQDTTTRYDIGFYIAGTPGGALSGSECAVAIVPINPVTEIDVDQCGDFDGDAVSYPVSDVTVPCADSNGDGFFDLAICSAWDNNAGDNCHSAADAIPSNAAKCRCFNVETDVEIPECANNSECADTDSNPCTAAECVGHGGPGADSFGCAETPGNSGALCRATNGVCDTPENCNGTSATCPADGFLGTGTLCRADAGECDEAENCTGNDNDCPADGGSAPGTPCSTDDNVCTDDECDGNGNCDHIDNTDPCNDGLFCTENDVCAGGECGGTNIDCADQIDCTDDTCDEANNECDNTPNNGECEDGNNCTTDVCSIAEGGCVFNFTCGTDICRSPGYWATHSGYEKENSINVGQEVLDAIGGLEVCGQTITTTSNLGSPYVDGLGLTSDLEGLCKRTKGVHQRSLYRQLVAAGLNCGISGGDCDTILAKYVDVSFSDCSDVCEGNPPVDGPTVQECIGNLDCFNNGGQMIDDVCVYDILGNCHDAPLCNEALGVCPKKTPASSPNACREARGNSCTIDNCP